MDEVRYLGDVQRLVLREGDIVVLKYAGSLSQEQADRITAEASKKIPGHKIMVLTDGIDIGVLAKEG